MTDSSPLIPWVTALLGCAVSYGMARFNPGDVTFFRVLFAGAKAFALSIVLFFIGALLHGICIDALHRCASHGEGNIQFAMGGVLAFPLFWLILVLFGRASEVQTVPSISAQCEAACSTALIQHLEGQPASTLCPACKQVVAIRRHDASDGRTYFATRCACGKCDQRIQARSRDA
jgi:hypothetical protein